MLLTTCAVRSPGRFILRGAMPSSARKSILISARRGRPPIRANAQSTARWGRAGPYLSVFKRAGDTNDAAFDSRLRR